MSNENTRRHQQSAYEKALNPKMMPVNNNVEISSNIGSDIIDIQTHSNKGVVIENLNRRSISPSKLSA